MANLNQTLIMNHVKPFREIAEELLSTLSDVEDEQKVYRQTMQNLIDKRRFWWKFSFKKNAREKRKIENHLIIVCLGVHFQVVGSQMWQTVTDIIDVKMLCLLK